MMKLQTNISMSAETPHIDYDSKVVLLGSCFSEHMAAQLSHLKFNTYQNPFGILFNPVSMAKLVARALTKDYFQDEDVFYQNGLWHCLEVHSLFNASEKQQYLEMLNVSLDTFRLQLIEASHIIFTYGTAWVYRKVDSGTVVANCHKMPQQVFEKQLLSVSDISEVLQKMTAAIYQINSQATIIHTLSPVRHLKDGFPENMRSKAHLLSGIYQLKDLEEHQKYFPSYEIMMDELRDYRFYTKDMLHPNEVAIEIIWEKFNTMWVAASTIALQKEILSIQTGLQHRPFNSQSEEYLKFQNKLKEKIARIQEQLPHIMF